MSRHRLYRNYDFEEDLDEYDGDEYPDEDGYGGGGLYDGTEQADEEEEKAFLEQSKQAVLAMLGEENAAKLPRGKAEEAILYYDYNEEKAMAYLMRTYIDPPPPIEKKPATPSRKDPSGMLKLCNTNSGRWKRFGKFIDGRLRNQGSHAHALNPLLPLAPISAPPKTDRAFLAAFFSDMPWLNVPPSRMAVLVPPPQRRGGLLGGSSSAPPKLSKLQALAAQRKRKAEEAKKTKDVGSGPAGGDSAAQDVRELRNKAAKLSIEAADHSSPSATDTVMEEPPAVRSLLAAERPTAAPFSEQRKEAEPLAKNDIGQEEIAKAQEPAMIASPSAFAQALFGLGEKSQHFKAPHDDDPLLLAVPSLSWAPPSAFDAFLEPSPDDVVLDAQAKAFKASSTKSTPKSTPKSAQKPAEALVEGVKNLKVDFAPTKKSKKLNVMEEYNKAKLKRSTSFVVVGHVDAGKSTMMARLLLDLEYVDQRTINKFEKEAKIMGKASFALAWVFDAGDDERKHGVTINVATRFFETKRTSFTILDAPGHRDFVPNMIAGASRADFAVLVVDAKTGAFESGLRGQTHQHALILRSMNVMRIIVAVNKLDTVNWSQTRYEEIVDQTRGFLRATGFQMSQITFVPVVGKSGDNMATRTKTPAAAWYKGNSLVEELETCETTPRALDKPLRLPVFDAFKTAGSAISISGQIEAGSLQVGDALLALPGNAKAYVKNILRNGEPADWAVAGQNVTLDLTHIDPLNVRPGVLFCDPAKPATVVDKLTMKVMAFEPLIPQPLEVHRGRLERAANVRELLSTIDLKTGALIREHPFVVTACRVARIRVDLEKKAPLEAGQRVVLRSEGKIVAAGLVE
ncbi:hypothetical protein SEPCBS119000_001548 [Sporothrix epigloea]|uniref:Tr-type G domain-containing protein n=1 Tax=Sporothrix epigloea TaxID=1892477 RepID=A0ABP0DED7_9PEZI